MTDHCSCAVAFVAIIALGCSASPQTADDDAGLRRDAASDSAITRDAQAPDGSSVDSASPDASSPDAWSERPPSLPDWVGGVNLAGAEFGSGRIPGTYGTDYIYPSTAHAQHFLDAGLRVFRIPFRWGRMQHELNGELDAAELDRLRSLAG